MFEKLKLTEKHFEEINEELCKPEIISDQNRYKSLMKELKNLTPVVEKYRQYKKEKESLEEAKDILSESGVDKDGIRQRKHRKNNRRAENFASSKRP